MDWHRLKADWHVILMCIEMTYREMGRDLFVLFTIVIQPILVAFMALWMLKDQQAGYAIFVVVGGGMTGLWSSLLFLSGHAVTRDRWAGTLETIIGAPTGLPVIVFGRNIAIVIQSLLSMVASYTLASVTLGYALTVEQPILFFLSILMTLLSFTCFGLLLAPLFLLNPIMQRFQNGLEFPIYILCGFLFPIALLPDAVTPLSYILAPYWAARALHETSQGTDNLTSILGYWGILLGLGVIYLIGSRYLFRTALRRVLVDATLDVQ